VKNTAVRILLSLSIFAVLSSAQTRDIAYQGLLAPLNTLATFEHGYLAVYDRDGQIDLFGSDGVLLFKASVQLPGGDLGEVRNAGVDCDGTLAIAFQAVSPQHRGKDGGIALFDSTGTQTRVIGTPGFWPTQVAFAPEHSIWTIGSLGHRVEDTSADYEILRHYSQDGTELGRFLPRSSFPYRKSEGPAGIVQPVVMPMFGGWELRVTPNQVDILLHHYNLWIVTDFNGVEKGRWDISKGVRPWAITDDGKAWLVDGRTLRLFDRAQGLWRATSSSAPGKSLLGADGMDLVFKSGSADMLRRIVAPE